MSGAVSKKMKTRLYIVLGFMVLVLLWVIGNLVYRSLITGQDLKVKASEQQLSDISIPANRGTIYDANMNELLQDDDGGEEFNFRLQYEAGGFHTEPAPVSGGHFHRWPAPWFWLRPC